MFRAFTVDCWVLITISANADVLPGRVISVAYLDTFILLPADKQQVKIRLAEIDAPESGQPYGNKSKQALSGLIFGKDVRVVVQTTDRYGRTVGRPYISDLDICSEMVHIGAAWAYRQYLRDEGLLTLESEARAKKRGIWGLSEARTCLRGNGAGQAIRAALGAATSRETSTARASTSTTHPATALLMG